MKARELTKLSDIINRPPPRVTVTVKPVQAKRARQIAASGRTREELEAFAATLRVKEQTA